MQFAYLRSILTIACCVLSTILPLQENRTFSRSGLKQHSFLVVFPAIAQKLVDDADLPIWSARIMHPTPTSVEYSLVASLKVPPPFTVKLDPLTLNLFVKGDTSDVEPYIKVGLPEYNLRGNTTIAIENQTAAILDKPIFESFLRDAVYSEYFELSASGASNAHLGALKAHIHMDKTIKMKG